MKRKNEKQFARSFLTDAIKQNTFDIVFISVYPQTGKKWKE